MPFVLVFFQEYLWNRFSALIKILFLPYFNLLCCDLVVTELALLSTKNEKRQLIKENLKNYNWELTIQILIVVTVLVIHIYFSYTYVFLLHYFTDTTYNFSNLCNVSFVAIKKALHLVLDFLFSFGVLIFLFPFLSSFLLFFFLLKIFWLIRILVINYNVFKK